MAGKKFPAQEGKLYACKCCGVMPTVGQDRYYENIKDNQTAKQTFAKNFPDKTVTEWIGCIDIECFKKQCGVYDANSQSKPRFQPSKFPIGESVNLYKLSEEFLEQFEKKRPNDKLSIAEKVVFIESVFRTLSGNFKP